MVVADLNIRYAVGLVMLSSYGIRLTNVISTRPHVLVVDLDGTLTPSNSLVELVLQLARRDPVKLVSLVWVLLTSGRLAFKCAVSDCIEAQVDHWPWNPKVLDKIEAARLRADTIVLMTASDQRVASRVADYLGGFDAVFGSTPECNLKGIEKARLIATTYADAKVTYIGDSNADRPVWEAVDTAIGVGIDPRQVGNIAGQSEELPKVRGQRSVVWSILKALRPHQWVKNVLLFVPLVLAQVTAPSVYLLVCLGWIAFSFVASAVYLFNDLMDLADDRAHPRKRNRPLASGYMPIEWGVIGVVALVTIGLGLAWILDAFFALMLLGYLGLTTLYSLKLKRVAWVDVVTLSGLYTWRLLSGAVLAGVLISPWLFVFSLMCFLSLAGMKRITELLDRIERGSDATYGRDYAVEDWRSMAWLSGIALLSALVTFVLYLQVPTTADLYPNIHALWWVVPVLSLWLGRMFWSTLSGRMHDDPIVYAAMDPLSWVSGLCVMVLMLRASGLW